MLRAPSASSSRPREMAVFEHQPVSEGTVIALEGDHDVIDSQFRLLPPSSDVLVLSTLDALTIESEDQPSGWEDEADAKAFILHVHRALAARHVQVAAFINARDAGQHRLVLINGGSARAQVHCIQQIARRLTRGDTAEAEAIFQRCLQDGVSALTSGNSSTHRSDRLSADQAELESGRSQLRSVVDQPGPVAAPPLTLQPPQAEVNYDNTSLDPSSLDSAVSPELMPRAPGTMDEDDDVSSMEQEQVRVWPRKKMPAQQPTLLHQARRAPSDIPSSGIVGPIGHHLDIIQAQHAFLSPEMADLTPPQRSPDLQSEFDLSEDDVKYEFGHAQVIKVRGRASRIPLRKAKSMDRVRSRSRVNRYRQNVLQAAQAAAPARRMRLRSKSASTPGEPTPSRSPVAAIDNSTQTEASTTHNAMVQTDAADTHRLDAGIHVMPDHLSQSGSKGLQAVEDLFDPVIPFQEDYIIQLFDGNEDVLLDDILERFRKSLNPPTALTIDTIDEAPTTPGFDGQDELGNASHQPNALYAAEPDGNELGQAGRTDSGGSWPSMDDKQHHVAATRMHRLHSQKSKLQKTSSGNLSLDSNPPSMMLSPLERVIEIAYSGRYRPLDIQDCFRSVLDQYAPLRTFDPVDTFFGLQSSKLWKSTLSADTSFTRGEKRLDYVIAFGSSDGVSDDLSETLHGRLAQLGTKRSGLTRVITVEIRHLLALVLQRLQATFQAPDYRTILSNPNAVCELLVPHLESHLSSEPNARLLILRYSSDTLPMVLNLRHVLSESFMKVTAVVDPNPSNLPGLQRTSNYVVDQNRRSHSHIRSQPESTAAVVSHSARSRTRGARTGTMSSASSSQSQRLFAQADYIVYSTSTEPELEDFIGAVRNVLVQKNPFFEAEPEPEAPLPPKPVEVIKVVEKIIHVPIPMSAAAGVPATGGSYAEIIAASQSGQSAAAAAAANAHAGTSENRHGRAWSFVPSLMPSRRPSNVSLTTTRSRRTNGGPRDPNDPWELWHEDEEEDRMVQMLINPEKPTRRPTNWRNPNKGNGGNSRKALKWLGIIA